LLRWVRNFLVSAENKCLFVGDLSMIITCNIFRGKLTANYKVQEEIDALLHSQFKHGVLD
jgi:hypothetical protein